MFSQISWCKWIQFTDYICCKSSTPHKSAVIKETRKEPVELENLHGCTTWFVGVLTKLPTTQPMSDEVKNSTIQPRNDLLQ